MSTSSTDTLFWRLPLDSLFAQVSSSPAGLNAIEATKRIAQFGSNTVTEAPHKRLFIKGALAASIAIGASPLGAVFGFVGLPITIHAAIAGVIAAYLMAGEFTEALAVRVPGKHA